MDREQSGIQAGSAKGRKAGRREERGFTLVEVMITMAVSVLFIGFLLGSNILIQKANTISHQKTLALQDATQVLERIRNASENGLFPNNVLAAFPNNGTVAGFSNMTDETVQVRYVSTTANPLDVQITVNWTDESNHPVSYSLNSLVAQRG